MSLAVPLLLLAQLVSSHRSAAPAPAQAAHGAGGLVWSVPAGWTEVPGASSMRVATYRVGDAEMAIFYFGPGQGGSVESNVERWLAQFSAGGPGATKKIKAGDIPVTLVSTTGTYASGMPGGATTPRGGYALFGAIAEGPGGNVFFKLTGPQKTVDGAKPAFDALLRSLKKG